MNCPRCTQPTPAEASFCPTCGLDLSTLPSEAELRSGLGEAEPLDSGPLPESDAAESPAHSFWPRALRLHATRTPKRPILAATLAFFFGPFAYLYLEQANWFWWGLLGGLGLLFVSRGETLPLLVVGYMLHAYDVAMILTDEQRSGARPEPLPGAQTL
jgi:hypothetical protein